MRLPFLTLLLLLLSLLGADAQFGGLRAPFGFFWGDDIENVRKILVGAACEIEEAEPSGDRQAWIVTGLIRPGMKQAVFYFKKNALVEIELQYQNAGWDPEQYEKLMERNQEFFTKALGDPNVIEQEGEIDEGVHQTMTGFEWGEFDTQLLLLNYRVQKEEEAFQSVSVHYRYAFSDDLDNAGLDVPLEDLDDPLPISENESIGGDLPANPDATPEPLPGQDLPTDPVETEPAPLPADPESATESTEPESTEPAPTSTEEDPAKPALPEAPVEPVEPIEPIDGETPEADPESSPDATAPAETPAQPESVSEA